MGASKGNGQTHATGSVAETIAERIDRSDHDRHVMSETSNRQARSTDETLRPILLALCLSEDIKPPMCWKLAASAELWAAQPETTPQPRELGLTRQNLRRARALVERAPALARKCENDARQLGASIVTRIDPGYPARLLELAAPPSALVTWGDVSALSRRHSIAIVGPRAADPYALDVTRSFARDLAATGIVVVSGFARGVDACAHQAAVDAGGQTVAVLGAGIDVDYPRGQAELKRSIAETGCVVSEFPLGRTPKPWHFPVRNRIIAALAHSTLVVQATHRSGSLLTAGEALELGRDVWAIPGRITDRRSEGTNQLISDGAYVALSAPQLVEALRPGGALSVGPQEDSTSQPRDPLDSLTHPATSPLLRRLTNHEATAEELARLEGLDVSQVLAELLQLELEGRVQRHPNGLFAACSQL